MTPATQEVLNLLERPDHGPVWRAGLLTSACVLAADLLTPVGTPVSAGLAAVVLASLIARSEALTARLTALTVVGAAGVSASEVIRSGNDPDVLVLRLAVTALILFAGIWATWQVRRDAAGPVPAAPPLPGTASHPVERAAQTLTYLAGARDQRVHRVENAAAWIERQSLAPDAPPERRPWRLLRPPAARLPSHLPTGTQQVWRASRGDVYVQFTSAGQGDVIVELTRPSAPLAFIVDAAQILQRQLERAALVEQVHVQRELLRDLVYAFSHDLRTPITANILHSEAALGGLYGPVSAELAQSLEQSQQANRDLLAVSDQLMLLAEYESGDLTGDANSAVNLETLVRSVTGDVQMRGRERGIHFELNLHPCHVMGHAYDLRRAVQNLLENAVKFSPEHAFVKVKVFGSGSLALIEVMDQGPGVPEAQVTHLFRRFRTSTRGSGTGFGLYLTRRIAERYGGNVSYERSASDHPWTVFRLTLPLTEPPAAPASG